MGVAGAPEHDWTAASALVLPILRPPGSAGLAAAGVDRGALIFARGAAGGLPLHWDGPVGIPIAVAIPAQGFCVLVNAEHLVSWGVEPAEVLAKALANLSTWSAATPWEEEVAGPRRLLVSDSGERWDAARVLLPEVRLFLERELGRDVRILVAIPSHHMLVAGALVADDPLFPNDFRAFVEMEAAESDEPVDPRVFELVGGGLVELPAD